MKTLKNSVMALASVAAISAAGSAFALPAYMTNWYLDADGAGAGAKVLVSDYVDLNGKSYINNSFTSATTFDFNEAGFFNSFAVDSSTVISTLTSTFTGTGSGDFSTASVGFADGTLNIFSGATQIASFSLMTGSGQLQANSTLPNGTFSLIFQADTMAAGYFFDSFMNDLSASVGDGLTFGFATTNAIPLASVNATDNARLTTIYNDNFNPDILAVSNNGSTELLISNNGQFRMAVPEPGSLALVGLGFCLAAIRRRKVNA